MSSLGELAHEQGTLVFVSQASFQHLLKIRKEQTGKPRCPAPQLPYVTGKPEGMGIYGWVEHSSLL